MLRTDCLANRSAAHGDIEIPDYAEAMRQFRIFISEANHNQPGNPRELAARIVELTRLQSPPARFVLATMRSNGRMRRSTSSRRRIARSADLARWAT